MTERSFLKSVDRLTGYALLNENKANLERALFPSIFPTTNNYSEHSIETIYEDTQAIRNGRKLFVLTIND